MPRSMTGFGRGRARSGSGRELTIEIRSVNHRYCDVRVVASPELGALSPRIEKMLRARFSRGRLDVQVSLSGGETGSPRPIVDRGLARAYLDVYRELATTLDVGHDVPLDMIAAAPGVIVSPERRATPDELAPVLETALSAAVNELEAMRRREGEALAVVLREHLSLARNLAGRVAARGPEVVRERRRRLEARLDELLGDVALDPGRLAQEVALLADRMDVSEELERLAAHLEHAEHLLADDEPVGRKLDFLVQELNRETNTIASKASDGEIAHLVVELKAELERTREQVQNLE